MDACVHRPDTFYVAAENILIDGSPRECDWWIGPPTVPRFRNFGFETWLMVQHAWSGCQSVMSNNSSHSGGETTTTARDLALRKKAKSSSYSPSFRRALTKRKLSDNRRLYNLPRRMALSAIIEIYTEIWSEQDK
jgi:hypothetical protein